MTNIENENNELIKNAGSKVSNLSWTATNSKTKNFITNLDKLMKRHALSYRGLSKAIDVAQPYLARLIRGEHASPGLEILDKTSKFFGISIAQLIGDQPIDFDNLSKLTYLKKEPLNESSEQTQPEGKVPSPLEDIDEKFTTKPKGP